jgi:hypothetical protein
MIPTKNEFYKSRKPPKEILYEYPRVAALSENGSPLLQFPGEGSVSPKIYPKMRSYDPKIGDRVLLLNGIIIGSWTNA